MVSGNYYGASPEKGSQMSDLPNRGSQRQTIPHEAEDDLPPAYEERSRRVGAPQPITPTTSRSSTGNNAAAENTTSIPLVARNSGVRNDPEGYLKTDPMRWDLKEQRGDWDKYDQDPGCLCSTTGGVLCSARGGVMCSDREGLFCSDRNGRFFSDRGGLWCSDLGGAFCSSGGNEAKEARERSKNGCGS